MTFQRNGKTTTAGLYSRGSNSVIGSIVQLIFWDCGSWPAAFFHRSNKGVSFPVNVCLEFLGDFCTKMQQAPAVDMIMHYNYAKNSKQSKSLAGHHLEIVETRFWLLTPKEKRGVFSERH